MAVYFVLSPWAPVQPDPEDVRPLVAFDPGIDRWCAVRNNPWGVLAEVEASIVPSGPWVASARPQHAALRRAYRGVVVPPPLARAGTAPDVARAMLATRRRVFGNERARYMVERETGIAAARATFSGVPTAADELLVTAPRNGSSNGPRVPSWVWAVIGLGGSVLLWRCGHGAWVDFPLLPMLGVTIVSDDFPESDGTDLQGQTDDLGNTWACHGTARMEINANGARRDSASSASYRCGKCGSAIGGDQWCEGTIVAVGSVSADGAGPSCQMQAASPTSQAGFSNQINGSTNVLSFRRNSTTLGSSSTVGAVGHVLRVERISTSWEAFYDGGSEGSGTDSTYSDGIVGVNARGAPIIGTLRGGDFSGGGGFQAAWTRLCTLVNRPRIY